MHKRLTPLGRKLARLPVDPRLGRMVLEADRNGVLPDVLVIAAALSIQDPRERPPDHQQAADEKHRRFADDRSDFLAYRNLWLYLQEQQKALSGSAFRRLCRTEFLHYLRIREWQDLVGQLRQVARSLGISTTGELSQPGDDPQPVHTALLPGLLSHIGLWDPDKREYLGARGARFAPWPGSALFKKPPRWVMAGELVETSRLWGRDLGRVEPEWVEPLAEHLVKRTYSEPHWSAKQGAAMALERVTLYGVPLVAGRKVAYGRIDPEVSRDLFIRHALVQGEWRTHHPFFHDNQALLEDVEELEHRARRRDILVDDETLVEFYDERLPGRRRVGPALRRVVEEGAPRAAGPAHLRPGDAGARRRRRGEHRRLPGHLGAGRPRAAADLPVRAGHRGRRRHRARAADRPQPAGRRRLRLAGARACAATSPPRCCGRCPRRCAAASSRHRTAPPPRCGRSARRSGDEPFADALARELRAATGVTVPRDAWDLAKVPDHLRMTFRVEDDGVGGRRGQGPRGACASSSPRRYGGRWPRPPPTSSAPG